MDYATISATDSDYLMKTYNRLPGLFVRGKGCRIWDSEGTEYLDLLAGIAVCQLGHCHPAVVDAIARQAGTLMHTSNHMLTEPGALLAKKLCELSGMDRVFFTCDGTTAIEAALKIAKKRGLQRRPAGDYEIVSLHKSFHGRSLGSLSATAQPKYQDQFQPLVPGFRHISANDLTQLRAAISDKTAAVIIETIQGEGGVTPLDDAFVKEARALTRKFGALLIVDEVQTGIGRTGHWFSYFRYDIVPDVICVAKGLGGGFPIGACLAKGEAADVLVRGDHGSTFSGGPLACAAALATLKVIEDGELVERANSIGQRLREAVLELGDPVESIRGHGLMLGVQLRTPIAKVAVLEALKFGLVINATDDYTIRLVPPLVLSEEEVREAVQKLAAVFRQLAAPGDTAVAASISR